MGRRRSRFVGGDLLVTPPAHWPDGHTLVLAQPLDRQRLALDDLFLVVDLDFALFQRLRRAQYRVALRILRIGQWRADVGATGGRCQHLVDEILLGLVLAPEVLRLEVGIAEIGEPLGQQVHDRRRILALVERGDDGITIIDQRVRRIDVGHALAFGVARLGKQNVGIQRAFEVERIDADEQVEQIASALILGGDRLLPFVRRAAGVDAVAGAQDVRLDGILVAAEGAVANVDAPS